MFSILVTTGDTNDKRVPVSAEAFPQMKKLLREKKELQEKVDSLKKDIGRVPNFEQIIKENEELKKKLKTAEEENNQVKMELGEIRLKY